MANFRCDGPDLAHANNDSTMPYGYVCRGSSLGNAWDQNRRCTVNSTCGMQYQGYCEHRCNAGMTECKTTTSPRVWNHVVQAFVQESTKSVSSLPPAPGEGQACTYDYQCPGTAPQCYGGVCRDGSEGDACQLDYQCAGGFHCTSGVCRDGSPGDICSYNAQCADGLICVSGACQLMGDEGDTCSYSSQCNSLAPFCSSGACRDGSHGDPCGADNSCQSGACTNGTCTDGFAGQPCSHYYHCKSGTCTNGACVGGPSAPTAGTLSYTDDAVYTYLNTITADGTNGYLEVAPNLNAWLAGTASLSAWIKTADVGSSSHWLCPGITGVECDGANCTSDTNDIFWGYIDNNGKIGLKRGDGPAVKSTSAINNNVWRHVVLTRDHTTGEMKVYVDGTLQATATGWTGSPTQAFNKIGQIMDAAGTPEALNGQLDHIRIYTRVLTPANVTTLYGVGRSL